MISSSRARKRRTVVSADLTALIDMVFILLIFFLLTSLAAYSSISVAVPESSAGSAVAKDPLILEISGDLRYRIDGETIGISELKELIGSLEDPESISISAERSLAYGELIEALEPLFELGITDLSFIVETTASP